jgi:hypothetical protein
MKLRLGPFIVSAVAFAAASCLVSTPTFLRAGQTGGEEGAPLKNLPTNIPTPRTADGHPDLSGVWFHGLVGKTVEGGLLPSLREFDPKAEEPPPYQPWAAAKVKISDVQVELGRASVNCLPRGIPGMLLINPYPIQLIQTPGQLAQLDELNNNWRVVPVDGRPHTKDVDPTFNGEGIGHWEGDTLVIDVVGIDERTWNNFTGWFHSDQEHVIERFTRPDLNHLNYQVTIEDPKVLTKAWTSSVRHWSLGHEPLLEYYCTHNEEVNEYKELNQKQVKSGQTVPPR